ncbi:MAG: DUF6062 family protein [Candidatus Methylomirabilales bacterium]
MKSGAAVALTGTSQLDLLLVSDLKQALRQPACPLCRVLRNADLYYLRVFLREGKNDGRMLLRLLASWGLCARHAGALVYLEPVEHGDGLGMGTLYDWLLDQARRRLDDLRRNLGSNGHAAPPPWGRRRNPRQRMRQALRRLVRTTPCPACDALQRYADYVVEGFARALEPASGLPAIQEMYLASEGLCLPHWQALLDLRPTSTLRELITGKQREAVALLKDGLEAELDRNIREEVPEGRQKQDPAFARALMAVAGDTSWRPAER